MKILITGSHGTIGTIIRKKFGNKNNYKFICLDKNNGRGSIDILKDNVNEYFKDVDVIIHLAANPNPFINKNEARKNIKITKKIITDANKNKKFLKIILNASSINVYPYIRLFEEGKKINKNTPLTENKKFGNGEYGKAKIKSERLFDTFCRKNKINLVNLRFGVVTKNDLPPKQKDGHIETIDKIIHLKHGDLKKIIEKALKIKGRKSFVCVSSANSFINKSIRFPLK